MKIDINGKVKTTTKWYEDMAWFLSLLSLLLWPIGFLFGCLFLGLYSGFKSAERTCSKVAAEYAEVMKYRVNKIKAQEGEGRSKS